MRFGIVGAGLAGGTSAALLHHAGHEVEVFETKSHVAGNCYDEWDRGILVHRYGPHGFHTDKREVWDFVNRFARFRGTALKVVANTRLGMIPVPFNEVSAELVGPLGPEQIRELVFRDYSEKHWGIPWEQVPPAISRRLPETRRSRDCRYHLDRWQGVPEEGYTRMIEAMFRGCNVHLGCEPDAWRRYRFDHVIYTGSIDDYFGHAKGRLEYRSLQFTYSEEPKREHFQINECNRTNPWTRSVDHSHWLDQKVERTIVGYEFPVEWEPGMTRMYPKAFGASPGRLQAYREMARAERGVTFLGRLATYKYLDMDDVIAQVATKLAGFAGCDWPSTNDASYPI